MNSIVDTFSRLSELPVREREVELELLSHKDAVLAQELRSLLNSSLSTEIFLESGIGISMESLLSHAQPPPGSHPQIHFESGDRLENFEILKRIGSGSSSIVYLAHDHDLGRQVALKIMGGRSSEGRLRSELVHENIVRLYEERDDLVPDHHVLVMEYIEGPTLKEYLDACPGVPEPQRWPLLKSMWPKSLQELQGLQHQIDYTFSLTPVQVIQQIGMRYLEAIEYSHQMGILHLDFKPANILIAPPYARILITDFNVSFSKSTSTPSQSVMGGTLEYMAPEQKQALLLGESGGIDERADLYSIGAVLRYHKSIIAPDASWFKVKGDAELSVALDQLIAKAMSPRREDRYSSASEMLREITLLHRFLPAARRLTQESTSELRHHWMLKLQIVAWGLLCLLPAWRAWLAPLGLGLSLGLSIWFSRVRRQS